MSIENNFSKTSHHTHHLKRKTASKDESKHEEENEIATFGVKKIKDLSSADAQDSERDLAKRTFPKEDGSTINDKVIVEGTSSLLETKTSIEGTHSNIVAMSTNAITPVRTSPKVDRIIEIQKRNVRLSQLEDMMSVIIGKLELTPTDAKLLKVHEQIQAQYDVIVLQKTKLVEQLAGNFVILMARSSILPSGLRFFHCTRNEIAIESILKNGIDLTSLQHNFSDPEMGNGLYCSSNTPAYLCSEFPVAIVFKVVKDFPCVITKSIEEYRREKKLPEEIITAGYQTLQATVPALVNESLGAAKSEISLLNPLNHICIEGVILNPNIDIDNLQDSDIVPIETWLDQKEVRLHPSWITETPAKTSQSNSK